MPDSRLFLLLPLSLRRQDPLAAAQERPQRTKHGDTAPILDPHLEQEEGRLVCQEPQPSVNNQALPPPCPLPLQRPRHFRGPWPHSFLHRTGLQGLLPDARGQRARQVPGDSGWNPWRPRGTTRESQDVAAPVVLAIKSVTGPYRPHPPCLNPPWLGLDCESVAPLLFLQADQDVVEVLIELQREE